MNNSRPNVLLKLLRYVWAAPTTAVGAISIPLALISGGGVRIHSGVIEVYGGLVSGFLRYCTILSGGASAMTLGHIVLARTQELHDLTRSHERVHVRQCERWGPFFLPVYLGVSFYLFVKTRDKERAYRDNFFEREAYENE